MFGWPGSRQFRQAGKFLSASTAFTPSSKMGVVKQASTFNANTYSPSTDRLEEGTILERMLPKDPASLNKLCRLIYLRDNVGGPAIDLYSELPWSDFVLTGLEEKQLQVFQDGISSIDIPSLMADITKEFLVIGRAIGSANWDSTAGSWLEVIFHDPDFCDIFVRPVRDMPPRIDLKSTPAWKEFAQSKDKRDLELIKDLDKELVNRMKGGASIPLATENTMYYARRASPYDYLGTSIYTRLFLIYSVEKSLWSATISGAKRRAAGALVVTAGIEGQWEPSDDEMSALTDMFVKSEEDPVGAVIVTRQGVETNRLDSNQSMWTVTSEAAAFKEMKMNSLGINDSLLSGDVSLQTKEAALSVFLDRLKASRDHGTREIIYKRLFNPIAKAHEIYKTRPTEVANRYRIKDDRKLAIPELTWTKSLEPIADDEYLNVLGTIEEKGVPVQLRHWAAAAGFNLDRALETADDDIALREKIKKWKKAKGGDDEMGFGSASSDGLGNELAMRESMVRLGGVAPDFATGAFTEAELGSMFKALVSLRGGDKRNRSLVRKSLESVVGQERLPMAAYVMAKSGVTYPSLLHRSETAVLAKAVIENIPGSDSIDELSFVTRAFCDTKKKDDTVVEAVDSTISSIVSENKPEILQLHKKGNNGSFAGKHLLTGSTNQ